MLSPPLSTRTTRTRPMCVPNFPLKAISKYRKQSAEEVESHTEVKAAKRSKLLSFAWEKKLGGVMVWSIETDDFKVE